MDLFLKLAFLFEVGSMFGWGIEVLYRRFFSQKHWVNPGYLTGPCLPLYGMCLCIMYLIADTEQYIRIENTVLKKLTLFVIMALSITAVEYTVGMVCLKVTKVRLWDYSNHRGNVNGVICPLYSLYWAILGAVYYFFVDPYVLAAFDWFSHNLAFSFCVGFFYGIFVIDLAYSAQIMKKIQRFAAESRIVIRLEELREDIYSAIKQYGKPHFLLSIPSGTQLKEMLEKYRDDHFSAEKLKERLHIITEKDDKNVT